MRGISWLAEFGCRKPFGSLSVDEAEHLLLPALHGAGQAVEFEDLCPSRDGIPTRWVVPGGKVRRTMGRKPDRGQRAPRWSSEGSSRRMATGTRSTRCRSGASSPREEAPESIKAALSNLSVVGGGRGDRGAYECRQGFPRALGADGELETGCFALEERDRVAASEVFAGVRARDRGRWRSRARR